MKRIPLLLSFILLFATCWGQIAITSFKVKSNLPADVSSWALDPMSVLLAAVKIPGQKITQAKLMLQINRKGKVILCF